VFHGSAAANLDAGRPSEKAIESQHHDSSDHGHHEAGRVAWRVDPQGAADRSAEPTAKHAEEHRRDDASAVLSGHEQLGDDAGHQAKKHMSKHRQHRQFLPADRRRAQIDFILTAGPIGALVFASAIHRPERVLKAIDSNSQFFRISYTILMISN
jgi:hypothetical protein